MSYGPFQTKEAGDIIARFANDELLPIVGKIREMAIEVSSLRVGLISHTKINNFECRFKSVVSGFLVAYNKWSTPDLLFKGLDYSPEDKRNILVIADYMNTKNAFQQHIDEGFRLMTYIDNSLTGQSTAVYNRKSITVSLLAIVIALIAIFLQYNQQSSC